MRTKRTVFLGSVFLEGRLGLRMEGFPANVQDNQMRRGITI
jgi:hypothetical protein